MKHLHYIRHLIRSTGALCLAVVMGAGCGQSRNTGDTHTEKSVEPGETGGIIFSPKNGLLISPETAKFIGLETVEVSEQPILATREVMARVFRSATTNEPMALASALMPVADARMLSPGSASLATNAAPAAKVLRIERSGELQTGLVEAILQVNDAALRLAEGTLVSAWFGVGSTNAVTVVPSSAVVHALTGDFVYLENGAHFIRAAVQTGRTNGELTEVTDGLLAGDRVVIRPAMALWMTELHNINGGDACCVKPPGKP